MKISVITRHAPSNYGSLLQTVATKRMIEGLGHECEVVDYIRKDEHYSCIDRTMLSQKPEWNTNVFKRALYLVLRKPGTVIAGKKFARMREKYLNLSERYTSLDALIKNKPKADVYMTGSDQVWGKTADGNYDKAYFLTFADGRDKKISYAASFGSLNLSADIAAEYSAMLKKFRAISVREQGAAKFINSLGLDVSCVLDPTLMLSADEWEKFCRPVKQKKYVLVYQIHNDNRVGDYAKKVAKRKGLPLIRISPSLHQIIRAGRFVFLPDPGAFLSYIKNAECVITDSFHGTAFALTFNTPFVEILYGNGTEGRNTELLEMVGLTSRILRDGNLALADEPVDFTVSNRILEKERARSLKILKAMLEE